MQRQSAMNRAVKIGIVLTITLMTAAVFPVVLDCRFSQWH